MKKIITSILVLMLSLVIAGQSVSINQVDTEVYPRIKVYVTVADQQGEVVCRLDPGTFRLKENGEPRNLRVLYGEATETSIALLLDCSSSMSGVIDNVREAAKKFINILAGSDRACTYSFNGSLHRLYSMIDVSVGTNKQALINSLSGYNAGGGTALYDAVLGICTQEMAKETERRKAIVALTDGSSSGSLQTAVDAAKKHNVSVYTIGMGSVDTQALQELAQQTGGQFYAVPANPSADDLAKVYKDIRNRLRCQYTLIYETDDSCPDGAEVPIEVTVNRFPVSKKGVYKRPHDPARIVHNIFFAPSGKPHLTVMPDNPMECEIVQFCTKIKSTSCSDSIVLKNIIVRAYDVRPGDRVEVAKSKPFDIQSNDNAKDVVVEWDTKGYTGDRNIELVIDPSDNILEHIEEDNILKTSLNVNNSIHDLYIKDITYEPKPASPCNTIKLAVIVSDGCTCKGVKSHELIIEAYNDKKQLFGSDVVTITSGAESKVEFEWDPEGRIGHIPLTFKLDPRKEFGQEQTLENNTMQKLIEIAPILHELRPTEVTHPEKRFFVGDTVPFNINIEDAGICQGLKLPHKIRIRMKDAVKNRFLGHSDPFTLETQMSVLAKTDWQTGINDGGKRKLKFTVVTDGIREKTPPGKSNNSIEHEIEILPMPHDLVINSVSLDPESPVDGDPATVKMILADDARFPGIRLENVKVTAYERYSRKKLGSSKPTSVLSQQSIEVEFPIDTGGLAGKREIVIVLDPDKEIEELTPIGLDGENNNEHVLNVHVKE